MSRINTLHCNTMWYLWNMWTMMNTCCCVYACYCRIVCLALNTVLTLDTCWKLCANVNTGCVRELWPFRVMNQCSNTDCAQTQSSACGFLREGGQVSGVMVLVQESISYTPSLNQHSTPRSVHLETVTRCCTTATLAPSIRAQYKPEATSRWGRDTNTNSGSVWDSL